MPAGVLRKLEASGTDPVDYALPLGAAALSLGPLLGRTLRIESEGEIRCLACDRATRRSFGQGYCFRCFQTLARCDACIVKPELCHYAAGTCREPAWGEAHCLIPHVVYLANSSALKVGITRAHQATTRWIDQGASQALPILRVAERLASGVAEVALRAFVSDRTDWRAMLRGEPEPLDLAAARDALLSRFAPDDPALAGKRLPDSTPLRIRYPVLEYPKRLVSLGLEKQPTIEGTLLGIKGQYLLLDTGVFNVRKHAGHRVRVPE